MNHLQVEESNADPTPPYVPPSPSPPVSSSALVGESSEQGKEAIEATVSSGTANTTVEPSEGK